MRYLVLSDIHGNLDALDTVIGAAGSVDGHIILGDIVGYGAEPNAVIDRVHALSPKIVIRGNHDKVAAGLELPESFNPAALKAASWTYEMLTPDNRAWLQALAAGPRVVDDLVEICHGSPEHEDEYLFSAADAALAFSSTSRPVCLFGHTHVAVCYSRAGSSGDVTTEDFALAGTQTLHVDRNHRYLINPGAVGQPRDGNADAAFALYDSAAATIELRRIAYPVETAQARILAAGLPEILARRLGMGR